MRDAAAALVTLVAVARKSELGNVDIMPIHTGFPVLAAGKEDTEFVNARGFTIYSVSLDRFNKAWLQAIDDDQLPWPIQVCDLIGAKTQAAIDYDVHAIPSSFLLDQNGVIIGVDLPAPQLEKTLADLVAPV